VVALRADWTRRDADIAAELGRFGRNGVPLYLVYSKSGGPVKVLSEWLTEREVLEAIRQ
jgi:thiol:disulfide interchange protein DsbD